MFDDIWCGTCCANATLDQSERPVEGKEVFEAISEASWRAGLSVTVQFL